MATATPRRSIIRPPVESGKDINPPTVIDVGEDGAKAQITEQVGAKTIQYEAKVKQAEPTLEDEDEGFEDEVFNNDIDTSFEEIPKGKLDRMFDCLRELTNNESEIFFAKLIRVPDFINDNFNIPCKTEQELGVFQFSLRDVFDFIPQIQKINGNSGGYFNVLVYKSNRQPAYVIRQHNFNAVSQQIGINNLHVPNPVKEETPLLPGSNQPDILTIIREMKRESDERLERLLATINRPHEKSVLEKALEQKMLNDLMNPPERGSNSFEETMAKMLAMPVVAEKFAKKMFPENITPEPKGLIEQITEVANSPVGQKLIDKVGDIAEHIVVAKTTPAELAQTVAMPNPQPQQIPNGVNNEMQELLEDIVAELESDNPINAENELIVDLKTDYPAQYQQLQLLCKSMPTFEDALNFIMAQTATMQPNPFVPFLDLNETTKQNVYVWNERGLKIKNRLNELYNFLRSVD